MPARSDPQPTLFTHAAIAAVDDVRITTTTRTVTDFWIELDGRRFDAENVYRTLFEVSDGGVRMTDRRMVEACQKLGIIRHGGGRGYAAEIGPNFKRFMMMLRRQLRAGGLKGI